MEQTIPVVDLRDYRDPAARDGFVAKLGDALRELGFVAVEGHGIDEARLAAADERFRAFFALPEETKRGYEDAAQGRQRGYTAFGVEHAKDSVQPDLKEFFHVGREGDPKLPRNVWPDADVPGLEPAALALFGDLEEVAFDCLEALGAYLGTAPGTLRRMAEGGNSVQRFIHYPVCDGFDEPGAMRAAQHEDINLMTLLPPAEESGLELLTRDGEWLPIAAVPGQIIVDTGDMMTRLTNDRIGATTHRVVNPVGEPRPRYSMPFFVHPHPEVVLEVFPECLAPGEAPKYEPLSSEAFLQQRLREIGLA